MYFTDFDDDDDDDDDDCHGISLTHFSLILHPCCITLFVQDVASMHITLFINFHSFDGLVMDILGFLMITKVPG